MLQSGIVAPLPEAVAETVGGERLAKLGGQESQVIGRRGVDQFLQLGDDRDREGDGLVPSVLRLRKSQPAVAQVLTAERHNVGPALAK
jgi:hypothetical protein